MNNETARFWIKMIEDNGIDAIYDKTTLLSKFDISLPEEQKAKEQIEELVSWLEKQGYERKSK